MSANYTDRTISRLSAIPVPPAPRSVPQPDLRVRPKRAEPIHWVLPGLCENVRVTTSFGDLPVQALRKRDPLRTQAGTLASVEWVDRIRLDEEFLDQNPDARPVRIPAGAFGSGRPERVLVVSPQQYVNVSPSAYAQEFRRARDLTDRPGIVRAPLSMVSYYLFHCGAPALVMAEGVCLRVSP